MTVLETERLLLRRMTPDDVDALLEVLGDTIAMVHYPAPFNRERVEEWVGWNLRNYEDHGYGLWAVVLKETMACVGDCGLTWQVIDAAGNRELEVGWHIRRDLWNHGLATEAGRACRDYARDVLRRPHLISLITQENLASQAVARKLGMRAEGEDLKGRLIFGMDLVAAG